ncbi:helix-turn-helix domain-containing protein [Pseudonocardia charpentierae]|uniref:helix-turn-helix domain-containing protein n=1 Tax=Pseudonocardia charpentierae TaxID=3075545 RepID=UPI0037CC2AB4
MVRSGLPWRRCRAVLSDCLEPTRGCTGRGGQGHLQRLPGPLRTECLSYALVRLPFGIAGGLTAEERHRYRARQAGARPPRTSRGVTIDAEWISTDTRAEIASAGLALLAAGRPVADVARQCRVSTRTVARWINRAQAERSHGGNRAPLLISHTHNPQAGTRTQEGLDPK